MTLTRRDLLKGAAATGAAAVVGVDLASGSDGGYAFWSMLAENERQLGALIRPRYGLAFAIQYESMDWDLMGDKRQVRKNLRRRDDYARLRRDRRVLRKVARRRGRLARGVRRYQGLRRKTP